MQKCNPHGAAGGYVIEYFYNKDEVNNTQQRSGQLFECFGLEKFLGSINAVE